MATTTIQFRTDSKTKQLATELFSQLGIDMSGALNLFLHQVVLRQSIPFEVGIPHPNAETRAAFAELDATYGQGGVSVKELWNELES